MLEARFCPLPKWTRTPDLRRRQSTFRANYIRTLDLLETELRCLNARNVLIEAGFTMAQIRHDGWPKAGAVPSHPGVVLYFETKTAGVPLCFSCGTFSRLERAIDRYGVSLGHEQYRGFAALPAAPQMSLEDAARFIAAASGGDHNLILFEADYYFDHCRIAARRMHPDAGGNHEDFVKLGEARQLLDRRHAARSEAAR